MVTILPAIRFRLTAFPAKNVSSSAQTVSTSVARDGPRHLHWSRFSFRFPKWVSVRSELNSLSTLRWSARITPILASMVGPRAASIKACIASCHSGAVLGLGEHRDVVTGVVERDELGGAGQIEEAAK
jgi:hypothetical protein